MISSMIDLCKKNWIRIKISSARHLAFGFVNLFFALSSFKVNNKSFTFKSGHTNSRIKTNRKIEIRSLFLFFSLKLKFKYQLWTLRVCTSEKERKNDPIFVKIIFVTNFYASASKIGTSFVWLMVKLKS